MGLWVNLPVGSDDGTIHPLISKGETVGYKVYEKDGNIYFSLDDGVSAVEEVSTVGSGINFADGEAHLIFVERDSRLTVPQLRIHVYKEFEKSENTTNTLITNSGFLYLGASGPNGAPDTNAFWAQSSLVSHILEERFFLMMRNMSIGSMEFCLQML